MHYIRIIFFGDEGFIPFVREETTGFYLMPCMPAFYKDPVVYSEEILKLKYAIDDGRFEYSSKLEEQISVQACLACTSSELYSEAGVETQSCFSEGTRKKRYKAHGLK